MGEPSYGCSRVRATTGCLCAVIVVPAKLHYNIIRFRYIVPPISWLSRLDLILVESLEDVHFLHLIDLFGSVSLCLQFVGLDGLCLQLGVEGVSVNMDDGGLAHGCIVPVRGAGVKCRREINSTFPVGFEPTTCCLEGNYSILLSYGNIGGLLLRYEAKNAFLF